ncbi:SDR family NAD(P)-dependent oxidoreductase [Myroides phaeus]|uniref:NAD(P)-dependent dehydrogenase, short-chain alcohol dehydrogenase family n=1 Tax=Myroides phaeus TaxID=702745 RepID=A0A1G8DB68_9FLAO|nr:SDR family oxidoreductase [Myroides phaeus]SDH54931.1 NAD(P)-dependent dehydrogenase, short-chain alcohol dehydrogenase family [Myroides phaeus]
MKNKSYLIYGVSKGLGRAIAHGLPKDNDIVYGVSRSKPADAKDNLVWVPADLSQPETAVKAVAEVLQEKQLDYLIYNVGVWEQMAFTAEFDVEQCSDAELINLVQTNVTSCILALKAFVKNLRLSSNAKIVLIGSTWGLDNHNGKEVAFSASKFALRGIVHSMRETLRQDNIGITVLNLGYLATEYDYTVDSDIIVEENQASLIPLSDVLQAIKFVLSTSKASCVKEINMPAMQDMNI